MTLDEIEFRIRNSLLIMPCLHDHHDAYWKKAIPLVSVDGLWMEFGVYRGRSIQKISSLTDNLVYGFDSFEGLHEDWDSDNPKGVYNSSGQVPIGAIVGENHSMFDASPTRHIEPWNENVRLIKGYFSESLPEFVKAHGSDVAFLHIDSDLYSSCVTIFEHLSSKIKRHTIICFDEILDHPTYRDGELKAFHEFISQFGYDFEPMIYHGVGAGYTQACVRII
jgi:hypothetical protein